jgi:hypothetical protein
MARAATQHRSESMTVRLSSIRKRRRFRVVPLLRGGPRHARSNSRIPERYCGPRRVSSRFIVNHHNHNTDFFYALLVVRKNEGRGARYDVKHFFFRRGDEAVYEIPSSEVRIVDIALLTGEDEAARYETKPSLPAVRRGHANPERAKDQEFFAEFYPDLKSLFSQRLGAPYWKGPLTLIDGSRIDVVAVESADSDTPEYSIVTAGDNETCAETLVGYKGRKFGAARHAIFQLERDLNRAIYQNRK